MLKKTIKYTDYNGMERTEEFYFNINKTEAIEMEYDTKEKLSTMLETIVAAEDASAIIKTIKRIILKAYGEKSADGRRLIKSDELSLAFSQSEAFNVLFYELVTNADKAADFFNKIIEEVPNTQPNFPAPVNA